ncbi:hypothetical protein CcaverHIS002_0500830 [Cutaneotrichosporon cavernicola]|uniref:SGT1-domain-containing protein n=1 Tax=Cutaneotrichosporon cavernicola TaxID=279322 RepID=A0AA48L7Y3_9TREE|nr:uncharacterized protein CcaverHIS019_0600830 [Cutaneotrichosporon cavernicola]BEI84682.1 hypothetical protein CcaverHIS002_0500830 [Cutaneotrichosporon cavernicola]BEI93624.1 hypothetical protein CcaverHIS019_0600830 [Cutaneotrichosporon cavernicola]BEJ01401.1 hypothetical protein CcaverHIS631_0600830 [Cutaneotrichosporon cavernicola]BEJ09168.1 hypothetical protein CcaverHIS641_0600830 [Cutaneotrichosporon cavernicola]
MDGPSTSRAFPLPLISEDTLHYVLHPASASSEADLAALATLISTRVASLLPKPWLWNKDPWELKAVPSEGKLEGLMRVGDAVDDEWLVVWLLREVSRTWPELVVSIRDSDGEFLLIEAANVLPGWVTPENAENRLWLCAGHLNLLPLSVVSSSRPHQIADDQYDDSGRAIDADAWINQADAVAAVRTGKYRAPEIEAAVWERIACYPEALKTHQHRTNAYLPVPIARALHSDPELIQRAVEGFYVRDPAQLRAASRMTHFPPSPAMLSSVLMTRAAYAQLQGQVFHPPRVFGPEWHVREDQGPDERRWRDLGVKMATGFEIMYREGGRKGRTADTTASPEGLKDEPGYARYIDDLQRAGYFGEEVRGSARWKEREVEAAKGWVAVWSEDTTQQRPSFAYLVDKAIDATKPEDISPPADEDSEAWLEVDPAELDAMLNRAAGRQAPSGDMEIGEEHGRALKNLAGQLEAFVGGEGDLEGARFADELSDEDMDSDSEEEEAAPTAEEREERMRNLVPALPEGEWGARGADGKATAEAEDDDVEMAPPPAKGTVAGTAFGDSLLPPQMRAPRFEAVHYDGVESDSSDEEDLPPQGTLGRHISEMKWGDAPRKEAMIEEIDDDDNDGDEEDRKDRERKKALTFDDDIDEQMRRRVWGGDDEEDEEDEMEDIKEGQRRTEDRDGPDEDEFLRFARDALGIDADAWDNILAQRRARGAFVPGSAALRPSATKSKSADAAPKPDPSLNSFESMMAAMDNELARHHAAEEVPTLGGPVFTKPAGAGAALKKKKKGKGKSKGKGKMPTVSFADEDEPGPDEGRYKNIASLPRPDEIDDMSDDALAAMDAELRAALKESGADDEPEGMDDDARREYGMVRDLLESYAAQGGQAGVVGNLVGRLGEAAKVQEGKKK